MSIIKVKNLCKSYKYYKKEEGLKGSLKNLIHRQSLYKEAVKNLNFEIEEGDFIGFIGLNGAGKTTTLKMLSGILKPTAGDIDILGYDPFGRDYKFLKQISFVMGNKSQLWWDIPAIDSIKMNKDIYGVSDSDYKRQLNNLIEIFGVENLLNTQVRRLSLGERMKMELIVALIHSPQIIFLDEPTIGLDIISQYKIREMLKDYNRVNKATIILTSHNLDDIESLCNNLLIIDEGSLIYNGAFSTFINEYSKNKAINIKCNSNKRQILESIKNFEPDLIEENVDDIKIVMNSEKVLMLTNVLLGEHLSDIKDISIENTDIHEILRKFYD